MTDTVAILIGVVTLAFAFGMAIGAISEHQRQRRRNAQKEIDWMREPPPMKVGVVYCGCTGGCMMSVAETLGVQCRLKGL